jgi:hypothetical protein
VTLLVRAGSSLRARLGVVVVELSVGWWPSLCNKKREKKSDGKR